MYLQFFRKKGFYSRPEFWNYFLFV
ncbi:hypothetical protein FH594_20615 (plasmid) [Leptospira interrogans]|nr:hypothetical protein [Leptospira interrogans]ULG86559.1 hypothetical protein FH594_20615 [Leptospira interrogans]